MADKVKFDLVAATFTPMNEEGEVCLSPIDAQIEVLVRDGVAGAFVCGSTGEGVLDCQPKNA